MVGQHKIWNVVADVEGACLEGLWPNGGAWTLGGENPKFKHFHLQ